MRDAIVLGSGRSGTSLLAGLFQKTGYYTGDNLWGPTASNPLGYFEDVQVNAINEDLLDKVAPWRPRGLAGALWPMHRARTRYSQRWLLELPAGTAIPRDHELDQRMSVVTSRRPFLLKDPRFSYTLSCWYPHLTGNTVFICMFREPERTVNSIRKIVRAERYLRDLTVSADSACAYWTAVYQSIFHQRAQLGGEWLFVHYDEILNDRALPILERVLGANADRSMLRPELKRSEPTGSASHAAGEVYKKLLEFSLLKYLALR